LFEKKKKAKGEEFLLFVGEGMNQSSVVSFDEYTKKLESAFEVRKEKQTLFHPFLRWNCVNKTHTPHFQQTENTARPFQSSVEPRAKVSIRGVLIVVMHFR
jgi:hypothetical protein